MAAKLLTYDLEATLIEPKTLASTNKETLLAGVPDKKIVGISYYCTPIADDEVGTIQFFDEDDVAMGIPFRGGPQTFGLVPYKMVFPVGKGVKVQCSHAAFADVEFRYAIED